jgi:hypothetical protein
MNLGNRIEELSKQKGWSQNNSLNDINRLEPADKNMVYAFLDSFITKAKLQSVLR